MLNRNKSRHINRLKALLVLPLLMVFLMSFQVETVTQIKTTFSSHIEADSISNPEVDLLKSMLKDYNEDTVLIFYGKKTTVKDIVPLTYKVKEVRYNEQGTPVIQAENGGEESLKFDLESMPEGIYLQVSEDSKIVMFVKNPSDKNDTISVFTSKKEQASKGDKKEQTSKQSENTPSFIIAKPKSNSGNLNTREELEMERKKLKDSFKNKNREIKVDVRYELREEREKQREKLLKERRNHRDSITPSEDALKMREELQQQRLLEREKHAAENRIVSVDVFKNEDYKHAIAVDKNDKAVVLRFEIDENTSDASLNQIVSKFAEARVDFNYKVVKRNQEGKITKIRMTLNNRKGSQSKVNNESSTGIGSYILGLNEGGSIYIRNIN